MTDRVADHLFPTGGRPNTLRGGGVLPVSPTK